MTNPRQLTYYGLYALETLVLRRRKPLVAGIGITDVCNLQCKHCVVANTGRGHYPFSKLEEHLRHFFAIGARIIYLQGGEVMLWRDGDRGLNDVIRLAKDIGFFKVAVVTNGTLGVASEADLMWVSLDGMERVHDEIRGHGSFEKLMRSLEVTPHSRVSANMTLNRLNETDLEEVAVLVRSHPRLHGLSLNFHVPYPGVEDICLSMTERATVVRRILRLKDRGYPVLNSRAGLKALANNRWRRPIPMIHLVEQDRVFECCWGREQPGVCEQCGYGAIAEMSLIRSGNVAAMLGSMSLFGD